MTFTEAAVEVLRLVGKPLHYKRITEIAIERNLLSHVGKTPEVTMSSRLATMVKRDRGDAPITKVKPGVFGLREFTAEQLADLSGDVSELPAPEEAAPAPSEPAPSQAPAERRPLPGADVFPEEDDDDEPIFGAPQPANNDEEAGEGEEGRSKRRRRRRNKRGRGDDSDDTISSRERDSGRDGSRRRGRDRVRDEPSGDWQREPHDGDLVGKDLADAVASVLSSNGRQGASALRVAEQLVRRGRLSGDAVALIPTISAAVRADMARSAREHGRPRFRLEEGRIILVENLLPQDVVRAEQDAQRAAERQRDKARRAYMRRLGELPFAGLAELLATWLNAEGVVSLRAVRRPGAGSGELHMAGTFKRGIEEIRLAIIVYRDGRDLGRERVIEARGALHHYGNASAAWLITLGQVLSGAREEATAPGTAPIAIYDGTGLSAAMERSGVGLTRHVVMLNGLDFDLLDALSGDRGGREERRRGRGREERDTEREEDRPRRRRERERARTEERETDDSDDAELQNGKKRGKAPEAEAEATEEASDGDAGRRRRRRRRRGKERDREEPATAASAALAKDDEPSEEESDEEGAVSDEAAAESGRGRRRAARGYEQDVAETSSGVRELAESAEPDENDEDVYAQSRGSSRRYASPDEEDDERYYGQLSDESDEEDEYPYADEDEDENDVYDDESYDDEDDDEYDEEASDEEEGDSDEEESWSSGDEDEDDAYEEPAASAQDEDDAHEEPAASAQGEDEAQEEPAASAQEDGGPEREKSERG